MPTYAFDHWEVNGVMYTSVPLNFTVTADTTIMVFYIEKGITPSTGPNYTPIIIATSVATALGLIWFLSRRK